jgi:hypothetical protein
MAETLGSLCDKLTIVKLKQWHSDDPVRKQSLGGQQQQLEQEINEFISGALDGSVLRERLTFAANKVFKARADFAPNVGGSLGKIISHLAETNCKLWHEVEKGYEIEKVPPAEKDNLIRQLAELNLERNQCIDQIDIQFSNMIIATESCRPK